MNKKAIILLAGGMDSATCLAIAKSQNLACYALSFDYGQKHRSELEAAKKIAKSFNVIEHKIFSLPIGEFGDSALTDSNIQIPNYAIYNKTLPTYVPARNTIFLSIAIAWAEVLNAKDIFFGANAMDYDGYPDCRPEYYFAFEQLAKLATKAGTEDGKNFKIHTPLITLNKAEIIKLGATLGVDFSLTISCYRADEHGRACGSCHSCNLRKQGFQEAKIPDQTIYETCPTETLATSNCS
jgi:7-cyano-7-deazaguanine synthase